MKFNYRRNKKLVPAARPLLKTGIHNRGQGGQKSAGVCRGRDPGRTIVGILGVSRNGTKRFLKFPMIFTPKGGFSDFSARQNFEKFWFNLHEVWRESVSVPVGSHEVCRKDFRNFNFYPPGRLMCFFGTLILQYFHNLP